MFRLTVPGQPFSTSSLLSYINILNFIESINEIIESIEYKTLTAV